MSEEQEYEPKTINVKNVEQFEQMSEELLKGWTQPVRAQYAGRHGLKAQEWV